MPKAYWIAHVDVRDPERYKDYIAAATPVFSRFGAEILARGGNYDVMEGNGRARNVIIEFASMQAAKDCYNSPDYQKAKAIRQPVADTDIVFLEGVGD